MKNFALLLVIALLSGCVPFKQGGTTHYLVVGVGLISVNSTNQSAVTAVRANVVGMLGSTMPGPKFSVGYTSLSAASVATNQNAIVEIGGPGRTVNITTFK